MAIRYLIGDATRPLTVLAGLRLGPVRLSLDYNYDFTSPVRQIGVQLGVDVVTL